jgi:excisionase family DNA binding protein
MYDPIREQFYTARELAEILGIKPETIAAHARSGRLPACQPYFKGPWMFPKDEIAAYLRKRVNNRAGINTCPLRARRVAT